MMTTLCRVCVSEADVNNMTALFETDSLCILDMIQFCTGILLKEEEGKSSQICLKCLDELHTAHRFKTNCLNSESTFHEILEINLPIKSEPSIEVFDIDYLSDVRMEDECSKETKVKDTDDVKESKRVRKSKISVKKERKPSTAKRKAPAEPKAPKQRGLGMYRKLFCAKCDIKFATKKESDDHKKSLHKPARGKLWCCEMCGKSYAHRSSQITHMRSHYPPKFSCDHCDYKTYNKYDLVKHVRIHTGHKAYKCTQCPAAYCTSSNLRTHVRLLHERVRPFACHLCGHTFNHRAGLDRHVDAHSDIKRYVCEECSAAFTKRSYWKRHLQRQHNIAVPAARPGRQRSAELYRDQSPSAVI